MYVVINSRPLDIVSSMHFLIVIQPTIREEKLLNSFIIQEKFPILLLTYQPFILFYICEGSVLKRMIWPDPSRSVCGVSRVHSHHFTAKIDLNLLASSVRTVLLQLLQCQVMTISMSIAVAAIRGFRVLSPVLWAMQKGRAVLTGMRVRISLALYPSLTDSPYPPHHRHHWRCI